MLNEIQYQQIGNAYIDVHLGKKLVGRIVPMLDGFRYEPKGYTHAAGGLVTYKTIAAVKATLEA